MKKCPYCAEEIQPEAIKCKHCGEDLSSYVVKEKKVQKNAVDQKKLLKIIGICVAVFAALIFWYLAIPGVFIWYFFFNKNGKKRLKVIMAKAKQWNTTLTPYAKRHWKIITPVVGVLIVLMAVHSAFAPEAAAIAASEKYEFVGDSLEVTGTVNADCRCDVHVWVNDAEVSIADDHTFKTSIPMAEDVNTGKITIVAKATGGLMSKRTLESTTEATYQRKAASVEISNNPLENGEKKYVLNLKGIPNATVSSKDGAKAALDAQGNGSITVNFDNTYNVQNVPLLLTVNADGYMEGAATVEVKNLKYDAKRVADDAEKERKRVAAETEKENKRIAAEAENKRIKDIVDNMNYYSGDGNVTIAVHEETRRSRCLSYSCGTGGAGFIVISLSTKNVGSRVAYVNPNDVTLKDSSGRMYTYESETYGLARPFDGVSLQPDTYTSGALAFLVPNDEHEFTVIYSGLSGSAAKSIYVK